MMTKEEIFSIWAPDNSLWSRWTKPVLFAHIDSPISHVPVAEAPPDVNWSPSPDQKTAFVLDLPGALGVLTGLALATRGYRPVPLYNAVPLPFDQPLNDPITGDPSVAVNVWPILAALRHGADELSHIDLPLDAPPAFLLDANRHGTGRTPQPDEFDNRSVSFTTDFPSANFLAAHEIQRALLIQKTGLEPQPDLAHALRRWQEGAIKLEALCLSPLSSSTPLNVPRPSWYGSMFQRALASLGLRRALDGGFGSWIPDGSAGG
jgi:hypothetical protein